MSAIQSGGNMNPIQTIIDNLDTPFNLIYGFLLIIVIVFSGTIPNDVRMFVDSMLGRVLGIAVVYGVTHIMGWVYGLMTALAFLLILRGSPRPDNGIEGFDAGGPVKGQKVRGHRWFVEKVLGEHPKRIEVDKVTTSAIDGH
jgi:hypothetical protein